MSASTEPNLAEDQGRLHTPEEVSSMWTDGFGAVATRALQGLLILAAVVILVWGMMQVKIIVIPLLLALIIASAMAPLLKRFDRWGWPRVWSTVLMLAAVLLVFGALIWVIVLQIEHEWGDLSENAQEGFAQLVAWWNSTFPQWTLDSSSLSTMWSKAATWLQDVNFGSVGSGVASGLSAVGSFATSAVLFAVILFFFMKDGPKIWDFLTRIVHGAQRRRAHLMGERAVGVMGGYVRGTVIVALVDAVFIGLGLVILQVPLALPLALIVFVTAFIPIVGATLAGIVAALVTLVTNGLVPAIIVVAIVIVVNQLEGNFLQPVVLGKSLQLHELVVLLALTTGTVLGGIIGAIMSVPIAAVAWTLIKTWHEPLYELEQDAGGESMRERFLEEQARRKRPRGAVAE